MMAAVKQSNGAAALAMFRNVQRSASDAGHCCVDVMQSVSTYYYHRITIDFSINHSSSLSDDFDQPAATAAMQSAGRSAESLVDYR